MNDIRVSNNLLYLHGVLGRDIVDSHDKTSRYQIRRDHAAKGVGGGGGARPDVEAWRQIRRQRISRPGTPPVKDHE